MIYLIVFVILFWFAYIHDIKGIKKNKNTHLLIVLCLLTFLAGFRNLMGSDTYQYMIFWDLLPLDMPIPEILQTFRYEYGWTLICLFFKQVFGSFVVFQFFVAFLLNFSIYKIIKERAQYPFIIMLLYYITGQRYIFMNFDFMRESLATAVFLLWGFNHFERKKYGYYYIICLCCSLIHSSGLLLLGLPLVNIIQTNSLRSKLFFCVIILSLMFLPVFMIDTLVSLLMMLPNKITARIISNMLASEHLGDPHFFLAQMYPFLFYLICIISLTHIRHRESMYVKYLYYCLIILCFTPIILDAYRSVGYLFVLVFIPVSEFCVEVLKKRRWLFPGIIGAYIMFVNVFFYRHLFEKDALFLYYPYISIFEENSKEQNQYMRFRQNDDTTLDIQIYNKEYL